ncbi:hypothetical protein [Croceibacterium ferulae]|uniref:hypothetical protein n=1 Tax=Croceibacterium ferulae TaxID=1854641 RepID=UPI0012D835C0|nr:hypothetical protein [Croceibacterium ferulae]
MSLNLAVADYLLDCEDKPSFAAIRPRLARFQGFMDATDRQELLCATLMMC